MDLRRVTAQCDGLSFFFCNGLVGHGERVIEICCCNINLLQGEPTLDAPGIDLDEQSDTAVKRDRLRLSTAHFAKARSKYQLARQIAPSMLSSQRAERLVRALQCALP